MAAWLAAGHARTPYVPPPPDTTLEPLAFMDRFTDAELEAIEAAAEPQSPTARQLRIWKARMAAARFVDLTNPRTVAGMDALVASGVITAARRDAILTP